MNLFAKLKWDHPPQPDYETNFFHDHERFVDTAHMWQMVRNELIEHRSYSKEEGGDTVPQLQVKKQEQQKKHVFIPGYDKNFRLPKSCFSKSEMNKFYSYVLRQRKSINFLTQMSGNQQLEYKVFSESARKEQLEFLNFARDLWTRHNHQRALNLNNKAIEKYITALWTKKIDDMVQKYPQKYKLFSTLRFVSDKVEGNPVQMKSACRLRKQDHFKLITYPNPWQYNKLRCSYTALMAGKGVSSCCAAQPISLDDTALKFAEVTKADVVLTSSALKTLVNNHAPHYMTEWGLMATVKELDCHGVKKRVLLIDKPLPPRELTCMGYFEWYAKLACKMLVTTQKPYHSSQLLNEQRKLNVYEDYGIDCEDDVETFGSCSASSVTATQVSADTEGEQYDTASVTSYDSDDSPLQIDLTVDADESDHTLETDDYKAGVACGGDICKPVESGIGGGISTTMVQTFENISLEDDSPVIPLSTKELFDGEITDSAKAAESYSYRLWTLSNEGNDNKEGNQHKLGKDVKINRQPLSIIVRSQVDGVYAKTEYSTENVIVSSKVEYQPELGAETMSLSELTKEWIDLLIRPNCSLSRVRVSSKSEVIMIQRKSRADIEEEAGRVYNVNLKTVLETLQLALCRLVCLPCGQYFVTHASRHGAFAEIYATAPTVASVKGGLDLYDFYKVNCVKGPTDNSNAPWKSLDLCVFTPTHMYLKRVPGTFMPTNTRARLIEKAAVEADVTKIKEEARKKSKHRKRSERRRKLAIEELLAQQEEEEEEETCC